MSTTSAHSITWKVNIIVLFCILCIMTVLGAFSYIRQKQAIYAQLQQNVEQIGRRVEHTFIQPAWEYDYAHIRLLIELEMEYPHIAAMLYKEQDDVLRAGKIKDQYGTILDYEQFADPEFELSTCFQIADVTIRQEGHVMGTLRIGLSERLIREQLNGVLLSLGAQFLLVSGVLYITLVLILRIVILRPIAVIDLAVRQLADKDFRVRIPSLSNDELGRLATSFNRMAETIVDYGEGMEDKVRVRTQELENANKQLGEANLYQTRFFANMSHEFRTPLTLILGPVDAISSGVYGKELPCNHAIFQTIYQNGAQLLKLINNILDFSKIEAGKMQVSKTRESIAHLLELYVSTIKAAATIKGIQMLFNNNVDDDIAAWIDQDLFEKAVFNLLSNACKFTPEGGQILVQLDADVEADTFSVSVKDSGPGIPPEKLDLIFDRFQQVKQVHQQHNEGTGIGLALTKEIAHLHQGTVEVKSREGHGATFTLILPHGKTDEARPQRLADSIRETPLYWIGNSDPQAPQTDLADAPQSDTTVLIVDDAADMREFLASVLHGRHAVLEAHNGREGLKCALEQHPDLIVTDVMMPEMDGYELAAKLREHPKFAGTPILFVSARAEEAARIRGFEHGANDYIIKPFSPQELRARVKANLDMKRLREQVESQRDHIAQQKEQVEAALADKHSAYTQLAASEHYFRDIADLLPSAIVEVDREGIISYLNRAGQEFFELVPEDVIRRCLLKRYVHHDDVERFTAHILEPAETGQLAQFTFLSAGRVQRVALVKAAPIFQQQRVSGVRLVLLEVQASLNLLTMPTDDFHAAYQLSKREREVLAYVMKGLKNKEIADTLYITEITIKKHVSNILQKTGCKNRDELFELLKTHTA